MTVRFILMLCGGLLLALGTLAAQAIDPPTTAKADRWKNGPPVVDDYFPVAVWLQNPKNALRYKAAGINLYVGLWRGPTEAQLETLHKAGMQVICGQNDAGLANKDNPTIVGWMHGDEPDNAQSLGRNQGYGPPIPPETIVRQYARIRAADPTRPVLLNLGQGVAWDDYIGRGVRRNHPEDYPEYVKGCDIASFDIYPAVHDSPEVAGKLEFVARGVERLVQWTGGAKPIWNCIECTHIGNAKVKPTPHQVRAEVWMALIHGSRGLIYFVHQFEPAFNESALLDDSLMLAAVTTINQQIHDLARVLNSPTLPGAVSVKSSADEVPIAVMTKRHGEAIYLFAANLRDRATRGEFQFSRITGNADVEVLGESRRLSAHSGLLVDDFQPYAVHLYRVVPKRVTRLPELQSKEGSPGLSAVVPNADPAAN